MQARTHIHTHTTYTQTHILTCTQTRTYTYIHTHIHKHTHTHTPYTQTHILTRTHTLTYTHTYTVICTNTHTYKHAHHTWYIPIRWLMDTLKVIIEEGVCKIGNNVATLLWPNDKPIVSVNCCELLYNHYLYVFFEIKWIYIYWIFKNKQ